MKLALRPYLAEDDYWRMREFLRQVFLMNGRREWSWHVARLDYCRWHAYLNCNHQRLEDVVHLWETEDGRLAAIVLPEEPGDVYLQVHPEFDRPELLEEMMALAEERLAVTQPDGRREVTLWSPAHDAARQSLLARRGYAKGDWPEYQRRRWLDAPIPDAPVAAGYTVRSLGDGLELLERCYASGLGFHEGDIRVAVDNRNDPSWYRNIQTAPLYRRDLDIVAVAPDGDIAAFCTVWFDDATRSAYFEPVATVPAHQRRGLGKAVMTEGLRRLRRMGATTAFVSGFSAAANALYASVLSPDYELYERWIKRWP